MISKLLSRLPAYISTFGVLSGFKLAFQIERKHLTKSSDLKGYRVPGYSADIWLRETVSDHSIFWQCLVMQQYALDRFPHAARLDEYYHAELRAGRQPVIVDCGGNIGLASLWFANRFPLARIVVVEPDSDNFAVLQRNLAHLRDRVRMVRGGVWPESGWLRIRNPESGSAAFQVERANERDPDAMRACTIDELCELGGGGGVLVVKIDIEGAQAQLFQRNTRWVSRVHLVTLELDDWLMPWQGTSRSFFSCLSQYPFEYLLGGESIFCYQDMGIRQLDDKNLMVD